MKGLCLDTPDAGKCSREQAFAKGLIPVATQSYQPLPNADLIHMIEEAARRHGLTLVEEQLGMDLKGQRMFGVADVEDQDFLDGRVQLMIGWCNSYNKSMSARVCIGAKVFVCSNRSFHCYADELTGAHGIAVHSHRVNVRQGLWNRIEEAFSTLDDFKAAQEKFFNRLEETPITTDEAYSTIVRAGKKKVINKTKILTIATEWDRQGVEPESQLQVEEWDWHAEFMDRNAFSLFNAFTQIEKERAKKNPVQSNISTMDLTTFFHQEFNIEK